MPLKDRLLIVELPTDALAFPFLVPFPLFLAGCDDKQAAMRPGTSCWHGQGVQKGGGVQYGGWAGCVLSAQGGHSCIRCECLCGSCCSDLSEPSGSSAGEELADEIDDDEDDEDVIDLMDEAPPETTGQLT